MAVNVNRISTQITRSTAGIVTITVLGYSTTGRAVINRRIVLSASDSATIPTALDNTGAALLTARS